LKSIFRDVHARIKEKTIQVDHHSASSSLILTLVTDAAAPIGLSAGMTGRKPRHWAPARGSFSHRAQRMSSGAVDAFSGPKEPKLPKSAEEKHTGRRVIVVLEKAALETVKTKRGFELLNADEHKGILLKHKKEPSEYRPDIVHQVRVALSVAWAPVAVCLRSSSASCSSGPECGVFLQALLTLLDSPLNKAGLLQIYIHTNQV
jgi:hypothetical protein